MRTAELVGFLTVATDVGTGMPEGYGLRIAVGAVRLAELVGVDESSRLDAYYVSLLALSGCTADSEGGAALLGDEISIGAETFGMDWGSGRDMLPVMLRRARAGHGPVGGVLAMMRLFGQMPAMAEHGRAHCEVAKQMAESFGFDAPFREKVFQAFERFDGSGQPDKKKGEAIALPVRIMHVAMEATIGHHLGGKDAAVALVKKRARSKLDPVLAEAFVKHADEVCAAIDAPSPWQAAMDAEPGARRDLEGAALDEGLRAIGYFADLKSRYTRGHSAGVSTHAAAAARALKLGDATVEATMRAGLLHDIGCVAVSTSIWDKSEPLTDGERERIRMHSYAGERVLARAPSLSRVAEIANAAHERLDGSGYHRRLPATACPPEARVLAAADVYQALTEQRPYRAAFSADRASQELDAMARAGTLCPDAVSAVLGGAGHARPKRVASAGLTERELDVVRSLVRGRTNKEIATDLDISVKTVGRHLEHIFEKLEVTTRAAATMIALRKGLVD